MNEAVDEICPSLFLPARRQPDDDTGGEYTDDIPSSSL
jgi:hypothetical protein